MSGVNPYEQNPSAENGPETLTDRLVFGARDIFRRAAALPSDALLSRSEWESGQDGVFRSGTMKGVQATITAGDVTQTFRLITDRWDSSQPVADAVVSVSRTMSEDKVVRSTAVLERQVLLGTRPLKVLESDRRTKGTNGQEMPFSYDEKLAVIDAALGLCGDEVNQLVEAHPVNRVPEAARALGGRATRRFDLLGMLRRIVPIR